MVRSLPPKGFPTAANVSGIPYQDDPYKDYITHGTGQRPQTLSVELKAIRAKYPDRAVTVTNGRVCDLLAFADAGHAKAVPLSDTESVTQRMYFPPLRRNADAKGTFGEQVMFAAYDYEFQGKDFVVYVVTGQDGNMMMRMGFIVSPPGSKQVGTNNDADADALVEAATRWFNSTHNEILVFDRGFWLPDKELFESIQDATWSDVILDQAKKNALINDVDSFFNGEKHYKEFSVPWKRGIIFYGPPGNGKTISLKALMHSLSTRSNPSVELLYVKSFNSFMGPEASIAAIFQKARALAPAILVFEDIDSLVSVSVRSYFLNAVDGLESNHGILMVGTTNHLERLDPGIANRPSRFDRKYFFDVPDWDERVQYCEFWRRKLRGNGKVAFPKVLCGMIADITEEFSFAYLKEAFVASLLAIVAEGGEDGDEGGNFGGGGDRDEAEKSLLWKEIKKQIKILRDEMDNSAVEKERPERSDKADRITIHSGLAILGTQHGTTLPPLSLS